MGVRIVFNRQTLTAPSVSGSAEVSVPSPAFRMGNDNFLNLVIEVLELGETSGTPGAHFDIEYSNDGVHWTSRAGYSVETDSADVYEFNGAIYAVWFRVVGYCDIAGASAEGSAWMLFTVIANTVRSPA